MVSAWDFINWKPGETRFNVRLVGLLQTIVSGTVMAWFLGLISWIEAAGTAAADYYGFVADTATRTISAVSPAIPFRIATAEAVSFVTGGGPAGFLLGAVAVALVIYVIAGVFGQ